MLLYPVKEHVPYFLLVCLSFISGRFKPKKTMNKTTFRKFQHTIVKLTPILNGLHRYSKQSLGSILNLYTPIDRTRSVLSFGVFIVHIGATGAEKTCEK